MNHEHHLPVRMVAAPTCYIEEIPPAISEGETLGEARENLLDALKLVLESYRELGPERTCCPLTLSPGRST
jgi:hypothetical protein